jgi:predicted amidophosphoribosyltransferase
VSAKASSNAGVEWQLRQRRWYQSLLDPAMDLLFPPRCVACGQECEPRSNAPLFCSTCDVQLAVAQGQTCPRCAMACAQSDLASGDCGNCRGRKLRFAAARTIAPYRDALRQAVLTAKHAVHEPLAIALGQRLAEAIAQQPFVERPDVAVSVPMHWLKRLWRKTNPASMIAQAAARRLGLPYAGGALVCRRLLRRQATLTPPQRRQNVRGAFRASWRWRGILRGKRVLLIDDVMTTGATAGEASRALLAAGASAIYVAVVSRSAPDV